MGPMSSVEPVAAVLSPAERRTLLDVARRAIRTGLCGEELIVQPAQYSSALQARRASFVTINVDQQLRGCIGSLEPREPLVLDVVHNAHAAAFRDPRFPALTWSEFGRLDVKLSVLSLPQAMTFVSEQHLLEQLRPGIDGLILEESLRRGTFLPSVWEVLPQPREFMRQLKCKAGLPADYWSTTIRIQRYTAESIP